MGKLILTTFEEFKIKLCFNYLFKFKFKGNKAHDTIVS